MSRPMPVLNEERTNILAKIGMILESKKCDDRLYALRVTGSIADVVDVLCGNGGGKQGELSVRAPLRELVANCILASTSIQEINRLPVKDEMIRIIEMVMDLPPSKFNVRQLLDPMVGLTTTVLNPGRSRFTQPIERECYRSIAAAALAWLVDLRE